MKSIATSALCASLLLAGFGLSSLPADDDPYFRCGLDIPVEGTVRRVGVGDEAVGADPFNPRGNR